MTILPRIRLGLVLAMVLLGGLAWAGNVPPAPRPDARVMVSGGPPTTEETGRARARHRQAVTLMLVGVLWPLALLGTFVLLGGTRGLARIEAGVHMHWAVVALAVAAAVHIGLLLLTLPLDYYTGFVFQHQYGLSNQTFAAWLRDYLVGGAVSLAITLPLSLLAYALLRAAPHAWPWWLAAASLPVFLFIAVIQPVFIAPLFNTFTPLQDETLRRDILVMARAQGITARDVYQMDASRQSNAVNAYVVGFGPTHRIVLYDTLLRDFTPDEIKFVMAHEMGHYTLGHIALGIGLGVVGVLIAGLLLRAGLGWLLARHGAFFGAASIANPALYPLLLLLGMLLAIISTPISSAISRHIETQADLYALRVYGHPSAGIRAFHKLARLNISLEDPPRWEEVLFYSHPSITRRVALFKAHGGEEEP